MIYVSVNVITMTSYKVCAIVYTLFDCYSIVHEDFIIVSKIARYWYFFPEHHIPVCGIAHSYLRRTHVASL